MTIIAETATKKLAELITKLDEGSVHKLTRRGFRKSILGDKTGSSPLPTLSGIHNNVEINLDFTPYPEGGYLANIEAKAKCQFKVVFTIEGKEIKSTKFKSSEMIPITEIQVGDKDFDEKYFIETLEQDKVKEFLSNKQVKEDVEKLGNFDRFTFNYKHLKLLLLC